MMETQKNITQTINPSELVTPAHFLRSSLMGIREQISNCLSFHWAGRVGSEYKIVSAHPMGGSTKLQTTESGIWRTGDNQSLLLLNAFGIVFTDQKTGFFPGCFKLHIRGKECAVFSTLPSLPGCSLAYVDLRREQTQLYVENNASLHITLQTLPGFRDVDTEVHTHIQCVERRRAE